MKSLGGGEKKLRKQGIKEDHPTRKGKKLNTCTLWGIDKNEPTGARNWQAGNCCKKKGDRGQRKGWRSGDQREREFI